LTGKHTQKTAAAKTEQEGERVCTELQPATAGCHSRAEESLASQCGCCCMVWTIQTVRIYLTFLHMAIYRTHIKLYMFLFQLN